MLKVAVNQFYHLAAEVELVFQATIPWETKYELIFHPDLQAALRDTRIEIDWWDPDEGYEEDVTAFVQGLHEKVAQLQKVWPKDDKGKGARDGTLTL